MSSFFRGVGIFLLSFSVSMALGVAFGLGKWQHNEIFDLD